MTKKRLHTIDGEMRATPTAPPPISLPALSAALEGRTKGEWNVEETGTHGADIFVGDGATMQDRYGTKWIAHVSNEHAPVNAHAIVALMNAAPDLIEAVTALVRWSKAMEASAADERGWVAFDDAQRELLRLAARFSNTTGGDE